MWKKRLQTEYVNGLNQMFSDSDIKKAIKNIQNWTAPGIDYIKNFWQNIFTASWKPLSQAMNGWVECEAIIQEQLAIGQTVLLPQDEHPSSEKD